MPVPVDEENGFAEGDGVGLELIEEQSAAASRSRLREENGGAHEGRLGHQLLLDPVGIVLHDVVVVRAADQVEPDEEDVLGDEGEVLRAGGLPRDGEAAAEVRFETQEVRVPIVECQGRVVAVPGFVVSGAHEGRDREHLEHIGDLLVAELFAGRAAGEDVSHVHHELAGAVEIVIEAVLLQDRELTVVVRDVADGGEGDALGAGGDCP
jgi:hypothetical protein